MVKEKRRQEIKKEKRVWKKDPAAKIDSGEKKR